MGEDIRRRVISSFKNAIDFEQNNNDLEAYRKYLDGVALVAAALQQDAECTWTSGNPNLSDKERRHLLDFAKQSVDRLMFILDKQDSSSLFKGTTSTREWGNQDISPSKPTHSGPRYQNEASAASYNVVNRRPAVEQADENDISPMAQMRKENQILIKRYAARLRGTTTKTQRHNLQLELERRLMENMTIAQQQQETWEKHRKKITDWCQQIAEEKFKIKQKIQDGSITEADFKKQRLFASALQYEEEHAWLKKMKHDILISPRDEARVREIVGFVMNDQSHPFGNLMVQMQHNILNKISPLVIAKQDSLVPNGGCGNINERLQRVSMVSSGNEVNPAIPQVDCIAQEERKAFQRHFLNISDDIKQDIRLIETLLCAMYEPLNSELGNNVLTELLHELYFPPIKPSLIVLLRLGMQDVEEEFALRLAAEGQQEIPENMDEELVRSCAHALRRLAAIGSPCLMLDSLGAILKCLVTAEDGQTLSIGADDLLPRLMVVVMRCGMPQLMAEAAYMENFMPVSRALGEAGYCLTVLQSVMTCVQIPTG